MKACSKPKTTRGAGWVEVAVPGADVLAFMGAAYQLLGEAHAIAGRRGRSATVRLRPIKGRRTAGLAARFLGAYADQRVRWGVARANLDVRAEVLRRALALAAEEGVPGGERGAGLTEEQAAEISRMLAEAELAPPDPLGVARPWDEGRP
jgi:hypothetical protein